MQGVGVVQFLFHLVSWMEYMSHMIMNVQICDEQLPSSI